MPCCPRGQSFISDEGNDSGGRRVVTPHSQSNPVDARQGRPPLFSDPVRFVLAPLILFFSGFFTADFIVSGSYTWPRTTRTLALTLTVLILSREFVFKEQLSRHATSDRALLALAYSCVLPYIIGVLVMLAIWAL
jgi:hypothetical protein